MLNKILSAIIHFVTVTFNDLWLLLNCFDAVNWNFFIKFMLFFVLWLGSGFLSATIAEMAGMTVWRHFFIGLLIPYFYPVYLLKHFQTVEHRQENRIEVEENTAKSELSERFEHIRAKRIAKRANIDITEVEPEFDRSKAVAAEVPAETDVIKSKFNREYFAALAMDETGVRPGPFVLIGVDGEPLEVNLIKDITDEFLILSINGKTSRFKFANIKDFYHQNNKEENV